LSIVPSQSWSKNDWADYWRYEIGVNIIPANTRNKTPTVNWKQYQNAPIPDEQHNEWKQRDAFKDGMAIIAGKVWHNVVKANLYLILVDLDNQKAIDEFCARNGVKIPLRELAKILIVEQHKDRPDKAHIIFYATHPFAKKTSDAASLSSKLDANMVPAIEVKGAGEHGLIFCTPSPHKNGHNYEIIGTFPNTGSVDLAVCDELERHIDSICEKYGNKYLTGNGNGNDENKPSLTMAELYKEDTVVLEGHNRHEAIMRYIESLLWNNPMMPLRDIEHIAMLKNNRLCKPPLDKSEFEKQFNAALQFIMRKTKEGGGKKNIDPRDGAGKLEKEDTDAGNLIKMALENCKRLFTDQYKMPFAQVLVGDHFEVMAVNGERFKRYIVKLFYETAARVPGTDAQNKAIQVLIGKAEWENPTIPLHLRVCRPSESSPIYYDLTNEQWQQIEIRKGEPWKVINAEESPVLFNRYGQIPQVIPERQYTSDVLDKFIRLTNIGNENDKLLAKVYLIVAFIPEIAHPIYSPFGSPGAAKSMLQTMIKRIVDPAIVDLLTIPGEKGEFIQQLGHNYMPFYDNLKERRVPRWLPQDICSAVTGAGNIKRSLFTDDDDFARKYKRCLGFNGINVAMTESDVSSRSITVKMESIPRKLNRPESEVYSEFEILKPVLLGFIFETISKVLVVIDSIKLADLPRLADFTIWGEAVARVLGYKEGQFVGAYYENIGKQNAESVESDQVGEVVLKLSENLAEQKRTKWIGTIANCRDIFRSIADANNIDTKSSSWPKISNQVSRRLNEIRTSLLDAFGIKITIEKLKCDREIQDEVEKDLQGKPVVYKYKRDTTLVTIIRLDRLVCDES
jgi:hypothetical protein